VIRELSELTRQRRVAFKKAETEVTEKVFVVDFGGAHEHVERIEDSECSQVVGVRLVPVNRGELEDSETEDFADDTRGPDDAYCDNLKSTQCPNSSVQTEGAFHPRTSHEANRLRIGSCSFFN